MKNVSSGGSQILGGLGLAQAVPPHALPLPQGEGEPFPGLGPIERSTLIRGLAAVLPLPKGEGWGEGEGRVEPAGSSRCGRNATDSRGFLIANLDSGGASKFRTHHK